MPTGPASCRGGGAPRPRTPRPGLGLCPVAVTAGASPCPSAPRDGNPEEAAAQRGPGGAVVGIQAAQSPEQLQARCGSWSVAPAAVACLGPRSTVPWGSYPNTSACRGAAARTTASSTAWVQWEGSVPSTEGLRASPRQLEALPAGGKSSIPKNLVLLLKSTVRVCSARESRVGGTSGTALGGSASCRFSVVG